MKKLGQGAVTTGSGTLLYTVPTGFKTEVMDICISNTSSSPISFILCLVPSGGSPGTSNRMFPNVSIPANTIVSWSGVQLLNDGDFIQGIGSASGITVNISGEERRAGT